MKVQLLELDGKLPNIALMRISAHHKQRGDTVELRRALRPESVERGFFDDADKVYASLIFSKSRPVAERLLEIRPDAMVGGTGWDDYQSKPEIITTLEEVGIFTTEQDYSLYPTFKRSIGYTQRGCRMSCEFCCVPKKEGKVRAVATIEEVWRGEGYPKQIHLLDNDFFGQPNWRDLIAAIKEGGFEVCFNQGINARFLNDESAKAIASIKYRDDNFKKPQIYTAWDGKEDEAVLFRGLEALKRHGVRPDNIMVYILIAWGGRTLEDWEYRRASLRRWGARPYPMPFQRTREAVGFQRWVIGAYDKRIPWTAWEQADYQPSRLGQRNAPSLFEAA